MACLSSWIVTIHLRNTRPFRNPHRKKCGTVSWGDRAGQAMSPKLRTQVTRCCTFQRSIATDHMKWRPLLYRSSSHQPWQAIASMQYSNLTCVSWLRATLSNLKLTKAKQQKKAVWEFAPVHQTAGQNFPRWMTSGCHRSVIKIFPLLGFTPRRLVLIYRSFRTTYWFRVQVLEYGTNRFSGNFGK